MSRWVDNFENHQIHNNLESVVNVLKAIKEQDDQVPDVFEEVNRLNQILDIIPATFSKLDPAMVPISTITKLDQIILNINSDLDNYKNTKDKAQLENANSRAENLLLHISTLRIPTDYADIKGIRIATSSLRRSVSQYIRNMKSEESNLKNSFKKLEDKINEQSSNIDSQKGRLDNAIAQFQQQFSQTEEQRREQVAQSQANWAQEFTEAVDKRKTEFAKEKEALKQTHEEYLNEINSMKDRFGNELTVKNEEFVNELTVKTKGFIQKLEDYKERAEELVNVIANTGMIGGYQEFANKERKAANLWKIIAVASFIGLIGFAIYAFYGVLKIEPKLNWPLFAGRVFVASTFALLGTYAARLADRHEEKERINRRMELELKSIDPYLVGLPKEDQHKIKASLAEKLFAKKEPIKTKKEEKVSGASFDVIKQLVETIKDLIKGRVSPNTH